LIATKKKYNKGTVQNEKPESRLGWVQSMREVNSREESAESNLTEERREDIG